MFQTLATHIMNIHMSGAKAKETTVNGELSLNRLKKFVHYCRT